MTLACCRLLIPCSLLVAGLGGLPQIAQQHKGSPQKLAVDVIRLNSGEWLYGLVTDQDEAETRVVVERRWLETRHPGMFRRAAEAEQKNAAAARELLIRRIDQWLAERGDEPLLRVFLEDERRRISQVVQPADSSRRKFIRVRIPASDIRTTTIQAETRHRIAAVAWQRDLANVSVRTAESLRRELQRQQVDIASEPVDLSVQVVPQGESDDQWAIRQALVEYELTDPLRFQGTGTALFRADQPPGLDQLIGQLAGTAGTANMLQQVGEELGIPEFTMGKPAREQRERDWWKGVAAAADRAGVRVFQVTRLQQQLLDSNSSVTSHLFARLPDGCWREIFQTGTRVNTDGVHADEVEFLRDDPQIRQVIAAFGQLGPGNVNDRLEQALRQGAATQRALNDIHESVGQWTARYRQRLDGPAVPTPRR